MRLSRAAFAVILKFSDQVSLFRSLWDQVELAGMGLDESLKGTARLNALAAKVKEQKADELDVMCKQWEQASHIRKWTQEMKKDLTETYKKEVTDELIKEINEKMKKEKAEKDEVDEKSKEDKESTDKDNSIAESKKEEDKPKEETKKQTEKEETKDASAKEETKDSTKKESDSTKAKETKDTDEKKGDEEEEDSDLFTGPLNAEQEAEAEDRAFKKMEEQMKTTITSAIGKANFVLKMAIPEAYQKQKAEDL